MRTFGLEKMSNISFTIGGFDFIVFHLLPEDAEERTFILCYVGSKYGSPERFLGEEDVLETHMIVLGALAVLAAALASRKALP